MCLNVQQDANLSKYYTSCTNVLTAASIQTHIKPQIETVQHKIEKDITNETGEQFWFIGGFLYTVYTKDQLVLSTPIKPFIDNLNLTVNHNTSNLTLSWYF